MTVTIGMKNPSFPDGYEFGIPLIGVVENNGVPLTVDDVNLASFEATYGMTLAEYFGTNPMVEVTGQAPAAQPQGGYTPPPQVEHNEEASS